MDGPHIINTAQRCCQFVHTNQCDQIGRLFSIFGHLGRTMKLCPITIFDKIGSKYRKILKQLFKNCQRILEILAKMAKFRQIWSHWQKLITDIWFRSFKFTQTTTISVSETFPFISSLWICLNQNFVFQSDHLSCCTTTFCLFFCDQCDQIWRNFASWTKISLVFWQFLVWFIFYLINFCA